jgi:hypothetical protein
MTAASVSRWVRLFPILQVAIAAGWDTFWALTVAMNTPTPQAAKRLPAVHPDVAKTLTTVALYKPFSGSISFDLYNYVTECCQFEDFWNFLIPW